MKKNLLFLVSFIMICGMSCSRISVQDKQADKDPLELWNDGPAKEVIIRFVKTATDEGNPMFLPVRERVAVFDMDGTLLIEKPTYVQFGFVINEMMKQIADNPELKKKQPYKAVYEKDWAYFEKIPLLGNDGLYSILLTASEGVTDQQYINSVRKYFSTVIDKRYNKTYNKLPFAPMLELIRYLHDNQFSVYIVSGSDAAFMRVFCEETFNIPSQNIIGTVVLSKWIKTDSGSYFTRINKFSEPVNDEDGKPVNILNKIGIVPALAVGNSTGDKQMLEYSRNARLSLQMIVNHDDSVREYYYEAEKMKNLCNENGWQEISMKKDFKVIFQ